MFIIIILFVLKVHQYNYKTLRKQQIIADYEIYAMEEQDIAQLASTYIEYIIIIIVIKYSSNSEQVIVTRLGLIVFWHKSLFEFLTL